MSTISARVLELLALLQSRRHWSGEELAERLGVSPRTLRRDVESLVELGYPIVTTRGTGGGYQLAPGGCLPPLVLSEDEAAAVVLALKDAATGAHSTESGAAVTALSKIVQVLPTKIRRRIDSLRHVATLPGPYGIPPTVDTVALTTLSLAARDHETVEFVYTDAHGNRSQRPTQPHHVVSLHQSLYLVAYDLQRSDWRTFRMDRIAKPKRTRETFAPRQLPVADPAEYVRTSVMSAQVVHNLTATVQIPAQAAQIALGEWGTATPIDPITCLVVIAATDLDWATFALVAIGAPFTIDGPEEAIVHARGWATRLAIATEPDGVSS